MHEAAVAQSLLSAISQEATKHKARPVSAKISCGKLSAVNDEALSFAFESIARETVCEKMELHIEHKPIRGKCKACGAEYSLEVDEVRCPACESEDFELLPDAPLLLEQIEFETQE